MAFVPASAFVDKLGQLTIDARLFLQRLANQATGGTVTSVTASGPVTSSGGATPNIALSVSLSGSNSGDVTLAGTPNYLTIVGQVITRALINLASHVTGRLPFANLTAATAASVLLGRRSGSAGDFEEVAIGAGLSMTSQTLSASVSTDYVVASNGATPPSPADDGAASFIYVAYTP